MKPYLQSLIATAPSVLHARNLVREYLQARILETLQRQGAMLYLAFLGGTSLRFLFSLPRFSEDLDFALERGRDHYDFRSYLRAIRSAFEAETYAIEIKVSDRKVVHAAMVKFPGLLYELGLSPHPTETLSIKLEVDTNPPQGAGLSNTLVRRQNILLHLQHYNQASLLAGKLHALLQRPYLKGRDVYDLMWYLSDADWPAPNMILLNNALRQTGWTGDEVTEENWRMLVWERLQNASWQRVLSDVRPFLEREQDIAFLTPENLLQLL